MASDFRCPIWGTPAEKLATASDGGFKVRSKRVDGEYRLSGSATETIKSKTPEEKARLTTWIVEQRRTTGETAPLVTDQILQEVTARRSLRFSERKQRFLLLASARKFQPSTRFRISDSPNKAHLSDRPAIAAWTECQTEEDAQALITLMFDEGIIRGSSHEWIALTTKGFEQMESLETLGAPTRQGFIAMWFDESMNEASNAIEQAIRDAGFTPQRIDRKEHGNKIDDEIIAEIRRSRFVVADFTCGLVAHDGGKQLAVARGGVYFEAGFALGLRTPVIWTCRSDCIHFVHFDTRQYNHLLWSTASELREKLTNRIRAMIV